VDDLGRINNNQASLIEANNRQVVINTETQKHINLLTDTVNRILKEKKGGLVDSGHLFERLLTRNRMLISEIQNCMLTITLAKNNIISPSIFNHNDLKAIFDEQLTEVHIVSLMGVSKIKIFQSNFVIHIVEQYPKVKLICKKILLFPVAHYHTILQLEVNTVAECDDEIPAVSDCSSTNLATFCKRATHDNCARQLHAGGAAACSSRPSNLEPHTVVDDGVIIVNEERSRVVIDDGPTTTI